MYKQRNKLKKIGHAHGHGHVGTHAFTHNFLNLNLDLDLDLNLATHKFYSEWHVLVRKRL